MRNEWEQSALAGTGSHSAELELSFSGHLHTLGLAEEEVDWNLWPPSAQTFVTQETQSFTVMFGKQIPG